MAQHDYNIANASFPTVRTDINNVLSAINSSNSGSSRPSSAVAGTIWLDTSGAATAQLLKMYDGAGDITLGTVNFTANTVDWSDSSVSIAPITVDGTDALIAGAGKLQFRDTGTYINSNADGDLDIVSDGTASDSIKLTSAGAITLDANATDGNGSIKLDSAYGETSMQKAGVAYATFFNLSNGLRIKSQTSNADMTFAGNDGGAAVTALTLDMSEAGKATFNAAIVAPSAYSPEVALTDASTITWNAATQSVAKVTLGASRTMGLPANPQAGQFISLLIIQDGTGSRTITWNAAYEFAADTAPTLTATANLGDLFTFRYNGAKWLEVGRNLALTLS